MRRGTLCGDTPSTGRETKELVLVRTQSQMIIKVLQNKGDKTFAKPVCNSMDGTVSWNC